MNNREIQFGIYDSKELTSGSWGVVYGSGSFLFPYAGLTAGTYHKSQCHITKNHIRFAHSIDIS